MATLAHCLFCFETLAAHLEERKAFKLCQVTKSWSEYVAATKAGAAKKLPALRRLADTPSSSSDSAGSSLSSSTCRSSEDTPDEDESAPVTSSPLFITWNTVDPSEDEGHLRGCIGTFEAQPIEEGLSSYAVFSAIHDTRFDPITLGELPSLEVAVTLLTGFEDASDAMDWEIGKHGLRISFCTHGERYGSTYLPDVAPEQGWTKEETVVSLMRKAGWTGKKERWREVDLKVVRYEGRKAVLRYEEFRAWEEWVLKR